MLVILTWATFFIPPKAVPARVTLIVTNLLSTLVILQTANSQLNKLDYRTCLDYFVAINVAFILFAMAEFITVLTIQEKKNKVRKIVHLKEVFVLERFLEMLKSK